MTDALLLDLDGTLLENDLATFTPAYFGALTKAAAGHVEAEALLEAFAAGIRAMLANGAGETSNHDHFWAAAEPLLPAPREVLAPVLARFYEEAFDDLAEVTRPIPGAPDLVAAAREAGLKLALATNPVFPRLAIDKRLAWAGLEPGDFDLVTCFETMRATKPHPAYFRQILDRLGTRPERTLMAGNHLSDDLVGARAVGMRTFFVDTFPIRDARMEPDGQGSLADLRRFLFG